MRRARRASLAGCVRGPGAVTLHAIVGRQGVDRQGSGAPSGPRWPLRGELRMPLQIGQSSLIEVAIVASLAFNTFALALAHVPGNDWVGVAVAAAIGVLTVVIATVSWRSVFGARASDLVLGPRGFRVEGGPRHGLALAWADLDPGRCRVENDRVPDPEGTPLRGRQLVLGTTDGRDVLAAEIWQTDDREALYVAIDEIRAVHDLPPLPAEDRAEEPDPAGAAGRPPTAAIAGVDVLRCDGCGAAAVPADLSHVPCPMCQREIAVPDELRRQLAEEAGLVAERERAQALVRRLLAQPGAAATNVRLALVSVVLCAVPVLGGLAYAALRGRGGGSYGQAIGAWVGCAGLVTCLCVLASASLARRVALRACLVELGARHDDGPRCRACGGALDDAASDRVLVRCAYCRCDNILGVDLRPWQQAEASRHSNLRQLLAARSQGDLGFNVGMCLVIAILGGIWPVLAWLSV